MEHDIHSHSARVRDVYYIICEKKSPEGIPTVKQLHVFNALEANTLAAEYIHNGWHVTVTLERAIEGKNEDNVISLFDRTRQKKQFKEATDILGEATARNIANKKRMEAERHKNNDKTLKAYQLTKGEKK